MYTIYNGAVPRWSRKKKAVVFGSIFLVLLLFALCLLDRTVTRPGVMIENGTKTDVTVAVSYKYLVGEVTRNMYGKVVLQDGGAENIDFEFLGPFIELPEDIGRADCRYASFYRWYDGGDKQAEFGTLFFDKSMDNLVLISELRQVYAADDEFAEVIKELAHASIARLEEAEAPEGK